MNHSIGKVITFYSYKGGVGRSMAMANIAVLLAQWGKKVLIVDWDLEAPGLEYFFYDRETERKEIEQVRQKKGVIDILLNRTNNQHFDSQSINWQEYETQLSPRISAGKGVLNMITSGKKDSEYAGNVRKFNYSVFYDTRDGGFFLEEIRASWILDNYDFVLIDSRTGLTESGGVCTIQMPDILVMLFTPNDQSLNGIIEVATKSLEKHNRLPFDRHGLRQLFIPTRFDDIDPVNEKKWLQIIEDKLTPMVPWLPFSKTTQEHLFTIRQLIQKIKIPYKVKYAYGEKLAVIDEGTSDPGGLGLAMETIAAILANDFAMIEALHGSRDLYIREAKGEKVLQQLELEKRIKEEQEEKYKLEKKIKKQKFQRNIFITVFSVAVGAVILFFAIYNNVKESGREDNYKDFNTRLSALSKKPVDSLNIAICELAKYDNNYNDNRIAIAKDSLQKICSVIEETQQSIDTNSNIIDMLSFEVPIKTQDKADEIDKIEHNINLTKNQIESTTDPKIKLVARQDSIKLEIKKQEIISTDTLLQKVEKPTIEIEEAIRKQSSINTNPYTKNASMVYTNSTWFKEGYYLQFKDIKVILLDLDAKAQVITVDICYTSSLSGCENSIIRKKTLKVNDTFEFTYAGYENMLVVDKIGNAGRNPFKKAAYITFEKYKK